MMKIGVVEVRTIVECHLVFARAIQGGDVANRKVEVVMVTKEAGACSV